MEIWGTQMGVAREVMETTGVSPMEVAAIGITNQRESTILWDKNTGTPIYNGIVWQCRRSAGICDELKEKGWGKYIKEKRVSHRCLFFCHQGKMDIGTCGRCQGKGGEGRPVIWNGRQLVGMEPDQRGKAYY